jgi:peptidoglycan hydrolase-like protein with peptidoglycan-binding domain
MRFWIIYLLSLAATLQVVGIASSARATLPAEDSGSWGIARSSDRLQGAFNEHGDDARGVEVTLTQLPPQPRAKPPASQPPNGLLKLGDRGIAVRELQQRLKQAGFYKEAVDGIFSTGTEAALKQFQQANKLPVDGMAGPQTQAALVRVGNSRSSSPKPLQLGSKGAQVEVLQRQLNQLGYYQARISGEFNSETKLALIEFQKANGLGSDGIAGRNTLLGLENAIKRQSVQALQRRLQARGFYKGPINGALTAQTTAAIAAAQKAYGISATDIVNGRF